MPFYQSVETFYSKVIYFKIGHGAVVEALPGSKREVRHLYRANYQPAAKLSSEGENENR